MSSLAAELDVLGIIQNESRDHNMQHNGNIEILNTLPMAHPGIVPNNRQALEVNASQDAQQDFSSQTQYYAQCPSMYGVQGFTATALGAPAQPVPQGYLVHQVYSTPQLYPSHQNCMPVAADRNLQLIQNDHLGQAPQVIQSNQVSQGSPYQSNLYQNNIYQNNPFQNNEFSQSNQLQNNQLQSSQFHPNGQLGQAPPLVQCPQSGPIESPTSSETIAAAEPALAETTLSAGSGLKQIGDASKATSIENSKRKRED